MHVCLGLLASIIKHACRPGHHVRPPPLQCTPPPPLAVCLQVNIAAAQAEAALTAFQQGLPLPPNVGLPSALAPGSAGAAMAAAGNLAAGGHNAGAAAAGVLPMASVPGVLPGGLLGVAAGVLPGVVSGGLPTPFVVVNGMINAATLADDEEYEEVRHTGLKHLVNAMMLETQETVRSFKNAGVRDQHRGDVGCRWRHVTRGGILPQAGTVGCGTDQHVLRC